jgi:hypothetical protein
VFAEICRDVQEPGTNGGAGRGSYWCVSLKLAVCKAFLFQYRTTRNGDLSTLAAAAHCQTDSTLSKSTTSPFLLITKDVGEEPRIDACGIPFLGDT